MKPRIFENKVLFLWEKMEKTEMKENRLTLYELAPEVVAFSTTRHGGYSRGRYGEFNVNRYCGDNPADIRRNEELLARQLGIGIDRLVMPHQVHGDRVLKVDGGFLALPAAERLQALEGFDAVMTSEKGVCVGVSTADCIPVLLYDGEKQAVCAVHAGWRGTVARIVVKAVGAMAEAYGTRPADLRAQIGPGISLESFEVGDEVYEAFVAAGFDMAGIARRQEKWHIDLPACNRGQLLAAGVPAGAIGCCDVCTYQHPDTYFSARRLGIQSGRIFTGIVTR